MGQRTPPVTRPPADEVLQNEPSVFHAPRQTAALDEYKEHHRSVWPEMMEALARTGWHNYSLFLSDDGLLIGYFETPGTFDEALAGMSSEPSTPNGRS